MTIPPATQTGGGGNGPGDSGGPGGPGGGGGGGGDGQGGPGGPGDDGTPDADAEAAKKKKQMIALTVFVVILVIVAIVLAVLFTRKPKTEQVVVTSLVTTTAPPTTVPPPTEPPTTVPPTTVPPTTTLPPLPTVSISAANPQVVCTAPNVTTTLTWTTVNADTVQVTGPNGFSSAAKQQTNQSISPSADCTTTQVTDQYSIVGSNAAGEQTGSVTVNWIPGPTP